MANLIGKSLGRYHILEQLGEGGMATVYKAYDTRLESEVAVKVIRTEELSPKVLERALKRFEREAKALAKLTHANIVKVTDYGEHEGSPYLVMTYLPGGTLKQKLDGKPMPWQEAIKILLPIARALDYAHRQNMIHRDVKPSNILITADGDPLLTDFGIAKIIDEEATLDLTGTSAAVGTPEYMAPEQATAKTVDKRADIYAFGIVLYEMVTGRRPFTADTPMAVLIKHATEPLPRPSQFVRDLPDSVEKILLIALAKKPDERYQNMAEMVAIMQSNLENKGQTQETFGGVLDKRKSGTVATLEETVDAMQTVPRLEKTVATPRSARSKAKGQQKFTITLALGVEMSFIRIPAGEFLMGSPINFGSVEEQPEHEVYLDDFWMGLTPVTNIQYQAYIIATKRKMPRHWEYIGAIPKNKEDHPVVWVTWKNAYDFCKWVGEISHEHVRLPTEAEWEKAARGTQAQLYPWGNGKPTKQLCNYDYGSIFGIGRGTTPVGQYSPQGDSPYGCVDMAGNVCEWVADWYSPNYYSIRATNNPQGPLSGKQRVLRGGSWINSDFTIRTTHRDYDYPKDSYNNIGFRCARSG